MRGSLPVLWDADFLYGPRTASGDDTYVLCEINVSSVIPFPDRRRQQSHDSYWRGSRRRARAAVPGELWRV